ncbi:hypothetical protein SUGI_0087980 [Cryptomeria japonica]|nr:hypothetical protein SUGI_0087980 [Cryptomeria japonica]
MEQLKPQIMATKGNEKQSEVDPNNVIPSFEVAKELLPNALVWASLHGFVVGDRAVQRSGHIPGVGLTHAPFSLFPAPFPETCWSQACDLVPLFNELVDRVSMDGIFLQESLSGTRKVDDFTARLLDIHSKTLQDNIRQEIRLGLHRSDYMLDTETGSLLQIELNTISSSFAGLGCLVSQLHRYLIKHFGDQHCLDLKRVPENTTMKRYVEALAHAWKEFNDLSSIVLVVVQPEERNMYDQHWICMLLKELYGVSTVQQELAKPNVLERFINNKDDALKLRKCFAGLWSLHSNAKIIQDAITMPEAFVLKP